MNNKVSRFQVGMFLFLISSSLYLGISDIVLLKKANDEVLISMLLGTILGLIPLLMYLKINSSITDLNIFEKNKERKFREKTQKHSKIKWSVFTIIHIPL